MPKHKKPPAVPSPESHWTPDTNVPETKSKFVSDKQQTAAMPKRTISGAWPLLIIWGLLMLAIFLGWLRNS